MFDSKERDSCVTDYKQVFIIGAPRSGTTFLASLLGKTSYGAPVETHFITKYYKRLRQYGDIYQLDNFTALMTDILHERPVQQWRLHLDIESIYKSLPEGFSYTDIVNRILAETKKDGLDKTWGDKTPHYIGSLEIITELFPEAKYIYIVRDGRDVALSLLEKNWGPSNIYDCAKYWVKLNDKAYILNYLKENGQLYSLTYEDLVDCTESHIRQIYQFLEEPVSESDVESLSVSVKAGNYGKWKKRMGKRDLKTFEAVAGEKLMALGYEVIHENASVPIGMRFGYSVHRKLSRAWFLFYVNVIDGFKIRFMGKPPFNE